MLICANDGFLSIVKDYFNPENLLVRGRTERAIKNVFGANTAVAYTPSHDYGYRVSLPRDVVGEVLANRLASINYTNFKDSVKEPELHDAYTEFWQVMYEYQANDGKPPVVEPEVPAPPAPPAPVAPSPGVRVTWR